MLIYWIWLATRQHLNDREKLAVLEYFGTPEDCYFAKVFPDGLSSEAVVSLQDRDLDEAEKILAACAKKKIRILTWNDELYPKRLKNIADPPLVLYYRGILPDFDSNPTIGVVGTRGASAYGLSAARKLGGEIAACGALVVSGMAEGIDAQATEGALKQGKGAVGVLGCGVDRVYPACNRKLYTTMDQQGCLLSEFPPGTPPNRWNFPKRNRIISGLSCGVLVVEAPKTSGALITARQAMEQGRDVFVVPGNIGVDSCEGSNALLRDGAMAVASGWDLLSEYVHIFPEKLRKKAAAATACDKKAIDIPAAAPYSDVDNCAAEDLDETERLILSCLGSQRQLMDTIIAKTGLPAGTALAALTMLEVKGIVATQPGGWVERTDP
ncbi:MAG: DNA-protecting protein DprA [Ruminococcaceae bacterium]|nr:DNA-protecting protein DprA [Oscillospiraceae bacterium]